MKILKLKLFYYFSGIIGCGYFHSCRNFKAEISDMIMKLVSAGRILWQWTKVSESVLTRKRFTIWKLWKTNLFLYVVDD